MPDHSFMTEVLRLLASSSDRQIEAFPKFVRPADELAALFEDLEDFYPNQFSGNSQTNSSFRRLQKAFDELQKSDHNVWTPQALTSYPGWDCIRVTAAKALEALGEKYEPPNLDGMVTHIKANRRR